MRKYFKAKKKICVALATAILIVTVSENGMCTYALADEGQNAVEAANDQDVTNLSEEMVTEEIISEEVIQLLKIITQPEDYTGEENSSAVFTIEAEGEDLSYQWQFSDDDGNTWRNSAVKGTRYATTLTAARDGRMVRCVVTDSAGNMAISEAVTMTIEKEVIITIITQPEDYTGEENSSAVFTIEAEGEDLSYQWQFSDDDGNTWRNSAIKSARYATTLTADRDGRMVRCIVTDGAGNSITSDSAVMQIKKIILTIQPEDYEGLEGDTVRFMVSAKGDNLTYQWQLSDDEGVTWRNSSITSYLYTTTLTSSNNGRYVRCVVSDQDKTVCVSDAAVMRVTQDFQIGFIIRNGITTYRYSDGTFANGLVTIDGDLYYFVSEVMKTGMHLINGIYYYFDEKFGKAVTGLIYVTEQNNTYYFDGENGAVSGWKEIDGASYYFNTDYSMSRGLTTINGEKYYFDIDTGILSGAGLIMAGNYGCFYVESTGKCATGLKTIEGKLYYFSENGRALTGFQMVGTDVYYFDNDSYNAVSGFAETSYGEICYFGDDFKRVTGFQWINGGLYFFDERGYMQTGLVYQDDGSVYCFDDSTGIGVLGWYTYSEGSIYYFDETTGAALTGWQTINGSKYYFNDSGLQKTGFLTDESGDIYYYMSDGSMASGWFEVDGNRYYSDTITNKVLVGLQSIDGELYYFSVSGICKTGLYTIDGISYYFGDNNNAVSGFQKTSTGQTKYFSPATFAMVTGLQTIDGEIYYFNESGNMQTGYWKIDTDCYYFDTNTGEAKTGFVKFTTGDSIVTAYGDLETGILLTGWQTIDGKRYCFKDNGFMRVGTYTDDEGNIYCFDDVTGELIIGFNVIDGKVNYYNEDGVRVGGTQIIGDNYYVFTTNGTMLFGLQTVDSLKYLLENETGIAMGGLVKYEGNEKYYMVNTDGSILTEDQEYWNTEYYVYSSGLVCVSGTVTSNGLTKYYNEYGEREYGLVTYTTSSGVTRTYYFLKEENITSSSEIAAIQEELEEAKNTEGWHEIKGLKYYVQDGVFVSGIVSINGTKYGFSALNNVMLSGLHQIDGNYYYFDTGGQMLTGFIEINGETRYFDTDSGKMCSGFTSINDSLYYLLSNGIMVTGDFCYNGNLYSADEQGTLKCSVDAYDASGVRIINSWCTENGITSYIDGYGNKVTGIQIIDGKYYLFDEVGNLTEGWYEADDAKRYFDSTGMLTGWQTIDENVYYFSPSSGKMYTGVQKIDEISYFFSDSGVLQSGFVVINGDKYYFDSTGLLSGWQVIDGKTYYFNESGKMLTGIQTIDEQVYYFDEDGMQAAGLVKYNNKHYYFDEETMTRQTGFITVEGMDMYFNPVSGVRVSGIHQIDGMTYYFDPETGERKLGFVMYAEKTYYFTDDSVGYLTGLQVIDYNTYCFTSAGVMRTGYWDSGDEVYYFNSDTGESISGVFKNSLGTYYYFQAGGGIKKGLYEIDGKEFYFYPTNGAKVEGLCSIDDKLYYFDSENGMLKSTSITVAGISYDIDENGYVTVAEGSTVATILKKGLLFLGYEYKTMIDEGYELSCSGLVRVSFASVGYDDIGTSVYYQWYNTLQGGSYSAVDSLQDAEPGDIIFFMNLNCPYGDECGFWNEVHHVGIYMGDNKILDANDVDTGVYSELAGVRVHDLAVSDDIFICSIVRLSN